MAESTPRQALTPDAVECSLGATANANALLTIGAKDVADVDGVCSRVAVSFLHEPALVMLERQCACVASDGWTIVTKVHNTVNN